MNRFRSAAVSKTSRSALQLSECCPESFRGAFAPHTAALDA
jgi:hypothetical protein